MPHRAVDILLRVRARWHAAVCVILACLLTPIASAETVYIVPSSGSEQYQNAARSCAKRLELNGVESKIIAFEDLTDSLRRQPGASFVGIGAKAASTLARSLDPSVPLYYTMTPSPERLGLESRNNTSGVSADTPILRQIEIIRDHAPRARTIGILYRSGSSISSSIVREARDTAPDSVKIIAVDLDNASSEVGAIRELLDSGADLIWTVPDPKVYSGAIVKTLLLETIKRSVPVCGFSLPLVRAGATFGIALSPGHQGDRVAELVIRGEPGVHIDAEPGVVLNLRVAQRIGHRFSDTNIRAADEVIGD